MTCVVIILILQKRNLTGRDIKQAGQGNAGRVVR